MHAWLEEKHHCQQLVGLRQFFLKIEVQPPVALLKIGNILAKSCFRHFNVGCADSSKLKTLHKTYSAILDPIRNSFLLSSSSPPPPPTPFYSTIDKNNNNNNNHGNISSSSYSLFKRDNISLKTNGLSIRAM